MLKLLPVVLICCMLGMLSQYRTHHDRALTSTRRKDFAVFLLIVIIMVFFAGLRTRYNDTTTYIRSYQKLNPNMDILANMNWSLSGSVGFELLMRVMRVWGLTPNTLLLIFAAFDIGATMWFIRRYSDEIGLCVFLVFTTGIFTFNLAAMMQCTATALALIAVDRAIRKKWVSFILLLLVAMTFHTYVLVFLITPFLTFRPFSKKTYLLLGAFLVVGIFLPQLLGIVVSVTSAMGESYDMDSFSGAGVNIFRFLVVSVPTVMTFLRRKQLAGYTDRTDNIIINLSMLNSEIMFVGLFGTANYFARLANYFLCFQVLTLPRLLQFWPRKTRQLITVVMVICYTAYFVYANAINQPFDFYYDAISIIDYFKSIL